MGILSHDNNLKKYNALFFFDFHFNRSETISPGQNSPYSDLGSLKMQDMLWQCIVAVMICCCHAATTVAPSQCATADGSVVKFFDTEKSWEKARKFCQSTKVMGTAGDLVVDTSNETHKFIDEKVNKLIWVGASDADKEKEWVWVNGEIVDLHDKRWADREPNNGGGTVQNCMVANYQTHRWDDQSCSWNKPFVCQYTPPAYEVMPGGRLVQRSTIRKTFADAQSACQTAGGIMVVPDNKKVMDWLKRQNGETWVGATDEKTEGEWIMSNGRTLSTKSEFWAPGSPNNFGRTQHCALYTIGGLNDKYCMVLHQYACQFEAC